MANGMIMDAYLQTDRLQFTEPPAVLIKTSGRAEIG